MTLFQELADWENGRLMCQNNRLVQTWMPGSFMDQRWGVGGRRRWEDEVKRPFNSCNYLLEWQGSGRGMCSFLSSCHLEVNRVMNKGALLNRQAEGGRVPWGRSLCMLIRTKAAKQGLNERKRFSPESKVTLLSYKSRYLRAQLGCSHPRWHRLWITHLASKSSFAL